MTSFSEWKKENNITYDPELSSINRRKREVIKELQDKRKKKQEQNTWLNKNAKGNIAQKTVATVGDIGTNLLKGVVNAGDFIGDLGAYGVAGISDVLGFDDYAKSVREGAQVNLGNAIFGGLDNTIDKYSVLGEKSDSVAQAVGQSYAGAKFGKAFLPNSGNIPIGGKLNMPVTAVLTGMSSGMTEAYKKGGNNTQAFIKGVTSGLIEGFSEGMFGMFGIGGSELDDVLSRTFTKNIQNQIARKFVKTGVSALGEGFEEDISYALNWIADNGQDIIMKAVGIDANKMGDEWSWDEFWENFLSGSLAGSVGAGATNITMNSTQNQIEQAIHDTQNNIGRTLTSKEQEIVSRNVQESINNNKQVDSKKLADSIKTDEQVIDTLTKRRLKEEKGKTYKDVRKEVITELEQGDVDINTINEVLGGEDYKTFQRYAQEIDDLETRRSELESFMKNASKDSVEYKNAMVEHNALQQQINNYDIKTLQNNLQNTINEKALLNGLISNSYKENAKRSVKYQADLSKYNDKEKVIVQKAIDSGILNDTRRSHVLVDMIAKLSSDKDLDFDFTNNENLKNSGFAIEGKVIDGYVTGNSINLNVESPKALNKIVGHEVTHVLEGTDLYTELKTAIEKYAELKGEYKSRLEETSKRYKGVKGAEVEKEVVADLVGDYIFNDTDFVKQLSTEKPTLFKKIYNEIKYLYKVVTAGSQEAKQLEKVKKIFEDVYRENSKVSNKNNIQYSLHEYGFDYFTKETINNLKQKGVEIIDDYDELLRKVNKSLNKEDIQQNFALGPISEETKNKITEDVGENLFKNNQYSLIVNGDSIIHISEHFNSAEEIADEIIRTAETISKYDNVELKKEKGINKLIFEKNYPKGNVRTVEIISKSNNSLNLLTTFYTKKNKGQVNQTATSNESGSPRLDSALVYKGNIAPIEENVKYSLSESGTLQDSNGNDVTLETSETGTHGTLMAIHNLTENKMKGILEIGGFPVPSIAITNPDVVNHNQFGNISVLFDKSTIDPSNKLNEVYDRDVWSPTFPAIDSEINKKNLESVADEIGIKDYYLEDIAEKNSNIEDLINQVKRHDEVVRKYLDNNNIEYNADVDTYKELRNLATDNGLDTYLRKQLSNILGEKGIYNGKEYLTPSGNRRTFWQLHDKYTLENLVKNLTKGKTTGTQQILFGAGFGPTSANMNNQFKTIEDIKNAENKIVSREEQEKQQIGYIANLESSMKPLRQYAVEGLYTSGSEQVYNVVQELSEQKNVNVANLIKILNEHGFNNVDTISQETLQNVIDSLNDLKNMPTDYFEAKPQRAVGLDEVQAVVIPNTTEAEFKQQLQDTGIKYYEYDPNIEGDRQRVINQFDDLKFSLSNQNQDIAPSRGDIYGSDIKIQPKQSIIKKVQNSGTTIEEEVDNNSNMNDEDLPYFLKQYYEDLEQVGELDAYENTEEYNDVETVASMDDKAIKSMSKSIKKHLGFNKIQTEQFEKTIKELSKKPNLTKDDVYKYLDKNFGVESRKIQNDTIIDAQDYLKSTRVNVSPMVQSDIKDYYHLKQENFGKIRFSKDGDTIDSNYQELNGMYPDLFPSDINNESDQLLRMVEVANMERYTTINEPVDLQEEAEFIYESILDYRYNDNLEASDKAVEESQQYHKNAELPYEERVRQVLTKAAKQKQNADIESDVLKVKVPNQKTYSAKELSQVAEILDTMPTNEKQKENRMREFFAKKIVDKGYYIDKLSREKKNRNLSAKYDYQMLSNGIANNVIGNGRYDNKGKKIGKSLYEIFEPIEKANLVNEFSKYMYHRHNIDRMSLWENTLENNKPVFGALITADTSRQVVRDLRNKYPEFEAWAQDVYDYNNANLDELVKNGVLSQEDKEYYNKKYPHYVPIVRDTENTSTRMMKLAGNKASVGTPIKKAKGGNQNLIPLKDAMSIRTLQTYNSALKNNFGLEYLNTMYSQEQIAELMGEKDIDTIVDDMETSEILTKDKNGEATFTIYNNGTKITIPIDNNIYDALTPRELKTFKIPNALNNFRRGVLTEYNPTFMLTNPIKDVQDGLINSKHPALFLKNLYEAGKQITTKGAYYQLYMANGGGQDTYFNYDKGTTPQNSNFYTKSGNKLLDTLTYPVKVLDKISDINKVIEMTPRLSEFISSIESGENIETAMYNASEVTTNFKRGGDVTKNLDRNGFTFLNASVQGAAKQVRNIQEAKMNGLRGIASLGVKFAVAGIPFILLNDLIWGDDEEYEDEADYVKNNYYFIGKTKDGKFIRIPKGRVVSVIQSGLQNVVNTATGEDTDWKGFGDLLKNNIIPSDPSENNLLSPLVQAFGSKYGKTWYGEQLVPTRLKDLPEKEQYDESTDLLSIWIGNKLNISPYKINYVLDQYSGAIGDFILPGLTMEAESPDNSTLGQLTAPIRAKFTSDSVFDNQNVTDIYDLSDELKKKSNSKNATDEDKLRFKYINSVTLQMSELYKDKREIQGSVGKNSEKYNKAREIQKQINELAKNGLKDYEKMTVDNGYAEINGVSYYKDSKGSWTKMQQSQVEKSSLVRAITTYDNYIKYSSDINDIRKNTTEDKEETISYINSLDLEPVKKAMLKRMYYSSYHDYDKQIANYIFSLNLSESENKTIFEELGYKYENGKVRFK